jgi:calcineurin-like phosphoesterase family protein
MTGPRSNGGPPSLNSALRARHPASGVMAWGRSVDPSRVVAAIVIAGLVLPAGCSAPSGEVGPSTAATSTSSRPTSTGPTATSNTPSSASPGSTESAGPGAPHHGSCMVAAAGDIAGDDFEDGAARTASLISSRRPRAVVAVGDTAYEEGSSENYADYYDPTWGAFKDTTLPVPGNHEYDTSGGTGFAEYFGEQALSNRSVDMCGWRLVLVNEYAGIEEGANFIAQQAGTRPDAPLVVVWHEPRFSSGDEHGSDPEMQPLWEAAAAAGAPIVLNGHDHDYERFAPLDAEGNPVPGGTTEFVTGLGGHHIRDFGDIEAHSEARFTGTPAVLFLTLRRNGYSWEERAVDGRVVDRGTALLPSP